MELIPVIGPGESFELSSTTDGCAVLVDKPTGWTSFDVVNKIRGVLRHLTGKKKIKVGHAGTLDPMASGLLLICIGPWTKKLNTLQGLDKSYCGTIKLGATTASYDAETPEENLSDLAGVRESGIVSAMMRLTGDIEQRPPIYSAIKVKGTAMYKLARKGKEVIPEPRSVNIRQFELTRFNSPFVDFVVHCSKGTYVRSLAHDLGQILGCGGYLVELRRTAIGPYDTSRLWKLDALVEAMQKAAVKTGEGMGNGIVS